MNEVKIIDERIVFEKEFRIYGDFENPLFKADDVAQWIEHSNVSKMLESIDDNEKIKLEVGTLTNSYSAWFLTEDGLYEVLMLSRKPIAKEWKKKVKDILKDIRKHGMHITENIFDAIMKEPEKIGEMLIEYGKAKKENESLKLDNKIKNQQILELQPKALYYDLILQCKELLSVTAIAKDYGKSAQEFNKILHDLGVQYKQSGLWFLYQKYAIYGYTQTKVNPYTKTDGTIDSKTHMYWTQKGRIFLYNLLKENGILPNIEKEEGEVA